MIVIDAQLLWVCEEFSVNILLQILEQCSVSESFFVFGSWPIVGTL